MRRHFAPVLLLLLILLQNCFLQQVSEADPLLHPTLFQLKIPLLRSSAVFPSLFAFTGAGLVFLHALSLCLPRLPLASASLSSLSRAFLWCGWLPLVCRVMVSCGAASPPALTLFGCIFALLLSRSLLSLFPYRLPAALLALLALGVLALSGFFVLPPLPWLSLPIGLACAWACGSPRWSRSLAGALLASCLALICFSLCVSGVPSSPSEFPVSLLTILLDAFLLSACLFLFLPPRTSFRPHVPDA